ncbi:MAG: hypothetical protein J6B28_04915 [Eubacterium sp.]|nr:hypothetical protein [Eubacterium sp.]
MLGMQIQTMLTGKMDMLILGGMFILICLSALQCVKAGSTSRQLKFLTKKLSGYLQAVLEDNEQMDEQSEEQTEMDTVVSRQEQTMRERIELQKQQKREKEAQLFDAVLSDIFP